MSDSDLETTCLRSPHVVDADSSTTVQLPEEILELVMKSLCTDTPERNDWEETFFDPSLGPCSLTCRYWAAYIRPIHFSKIVLSSQRSARTFAELVRSSTAVPGRLRDVVQEIELCMDEAHRPWMYHIWTLLRYASLPNLHAVNLKIEAQKGTSEFPTYGRSRCERLLDTGLPRMVPSSHPIRLHTLYLEGLKLRSFTALLYSLAYHCTARIECYNIQWAEADTTNLALRRLQASRQEFHIPTEILIGSCTAIVSFAWSLITTRQSSRGVASGPVYISDTQVVAVMDLLRHFSDGCTCSKCGKGTQHKIYQLYTYIGTC